MAQQEMARLLVDKDCKACVTDWLRGPQAAAGLAAGGDVAGLLTFKPCADHKRFACGCVLEQLDRGKVSMTPCQVHAAEMFTKGGFTMDFAPPKPPVTATLVNNGVTRLADSLKCKGCHPLTGVVQDAKLVRRVVVDGAPAGEYRCPLDHVFTAGPVTVTPT